MFAPDRTATPRSVYSTPDISPCLHATHRRKCSGYFAPKQHNCHVSNHVIFTGAVAVLASSPQNTVPILIASTPSATHQGVSLDRKALPLRPPSGNPPARTDPDPETNPYKNPQPPCPFAAFTVSKTSERQNASGGKETAYNLKDRCNQPPLIPRP